MEKFETLNSFIEGELDSTSEQQLFEELASNDLMRGEFKNLLAISEVVKSNRKAFAKNKKTKKAVFATLGLSIPVADAVSGGVASGAVGYGIKSLLTTGVLSAVATAIILFTFGNSNNEKSISEKQTLPELVVEIPMEIPVISSKELISNKSNSDFEIKYNTLLAKNEHYQKTIKKLNTQIDERNNLIEEYESIISEQSSAENEIENLKAMNARFTNDLTAYKKQSSIEIANLNSQIGQKNEKINNLIANKSDFNSLPNYNLNGNSTPIILNNDGNSSWSAEWKGSQTFHTNNTDFSNNDISQLNNNSLSIMYNFENGFSVGSELRQETFLLEFTGEDLNEITYQYRQEPNFTTLSLLGRYTYDLSKTVDPFAQITFGGNKIGIVGRAMSGVIYSPYPYLNMVFGLEYNNMFFQYQGNRFNAGKIGINYGLSVQF